MASSSSSSSSLSNKRAREADGERAAPVEAAEAKRIRPEDLLDMLEDDADAAAPGADLASVMRSLEEEIEISAGEFPDLEALATAPQPELGFLLEASDDELGLPPAAGGGSDSSSDAGAGDLAGFGEQIWGFEDDIDGGAGVTSSPEAAAAAAAAAAEWGDDGFDAGLFGFEFAEANFGPSDLEILRYENTMPAV